MEREELIHKLKEKVAELKEVNKALLAREEGLVPLSRISAEVNR